MFQLLHVLAVYDWWSRVCFCMSACVCRQISEEVIIFVAAVVCICSGGKLCILKNDDRYTGKWYFVRLIKPSKCRLSSFFVVTFLNDTDSF